MDAADFLVLLKHCCVCEDSGKCGWGGKCRAMMRLKHHLDELVHDDVDEPCPMAMCNVMRKLILHFGQCTSRDTCEFCCKLQGGRAKAAAYHKIICTLT